jgi:hypothetical protein
VLKTKIFSSIVASLSCFSNFVWQPLCYGSPVPVYKLKIIQIVELKQYISSQKVEISLSGRFCSTFSHTVAGVGENTLSLPKTYNWPCAIIFELENHEYKWCLSEFYLKKYHPSRPMQFFSWNIFKIRFCCWSATFLFASPPCPHRHTHTFSVHKWHGRHHRDVSMKAGKSFFFTFKVEWLKKTCEIPMNNSLTMQLCNISSLYKHPHTYWHTYI